jgi:hypothetical protein
VDPTAVVAPRAVPVKPEVLAVAILLSLAMWVVLAWVGVELWNAVQEAAQW